MDNSEKPKHLVVVNWNQFLQYKDGRRPSWIKIDCGLLDNYQYGKLSDAARGQLLGIQMLAASTAGRVPNDPQWIAERIQSKAKIELEELISNGFLQYAANEGTVQNSESAVPIEREYREREETPIFKKPVIFEPPMNHPGPPAWILEVLKIWKRFFGGDLDPAQTYQILTSAVKEFGDVDVLAALERYCAEYSKPSQIKFASLKNFAMKINQWLKARQVRSHTAAYLDAKKHRDAGMTLSESQKAILEKEREGYR